MMMILSFLAHNAITIYVIAAVSKDRRRTMEDGGFLELWWKTFMARDLLQTSRSLMKSGYNYGSAGNREQFSLKALTILFQSGIKVLIATAITFEIIKELLTICFAFFWVHLIFRNAWKIFFLPFLFCEINNIHNMFCGK